MGHARMGALNQREYGISDAASGGWGSSGDDPLGAQNFGSSSSAPVQKRHLYDPAFNAYLQEQLGQSGDLQSREGTTSAYAKGPFAGLGPSEAQAKAGQMFDALPDAQRAQYAPPSSQQASSQTGAPVSQPTTELPHQAAARQAAVADYTQAGHSAPTINPAVQSVASMQPGMARTSANFNPNRAMGDPNDVAKYGPRMGDGPPHLMGPQTFDSTAAAQPYAFSSGSIAKPSLPSPPSAVPAVASASPAAAVPPVGSAPALRPVISDGTAPTETPDQRVARMDQRQPGGEGGAFVRPATTPYVNPAPTRAATLMARNSPLYTTGSVASRPVPVPGSGATDSSATASQTPGGGPGAVVPAAQGGVGAVIPQARGGTGMPSTASAAPTSNPFNGSGPQTSFQNKPADSTAMTAPLPPYGDQNGAANAGSAQHNQALAIGIGQSSGGAGMAETGGYSGPMATPPPLGANELDPVTGRPRNQTAVA